MIDKNIQKQALSVICAVVGLSLASQVSFDVPIGNGIPITGQSFAILLIGYFLPWRLSLISVLLYIMCGIVGLPVFAEGSSGIDKLLGKSGGYLIGFIPAVVAVSLWEYGIIKKLLHTFQSFVFATGIILVCGVLRLSIDLGLPMAIEFGLKPFWIGALVKILLALVIIYLYVVIRDKR